MCKSPKISDGIMCLIYVVNSRDSLKYKCIPFDFSVLCQPTLVSYLWVSGEKKI